MSRWTQSAVLVAVALTMSILPVGAGAARVFCAPAPEGMTGWWPGDGSGIDLIGGRDASLAGGATFGPGLVGLAFRLFGDGDFAYVPEDAALNVGAGDFTVDLWAWFRTTEGEQVLVEDWVQRFPWEEPFETSEGWTLTKLDDNRVLLAFSSFGGAEFNVSSRPLPLRTRTWYHFAARRAGDVFSILMNGRVIASGVFPDVGSLDSSASLKFGHRGDPFDTPGSQDSSGFFLDGRLDEVELFVGRAVPNREIRAIVTAGPAGKC